MKKITVNQTQAITSQKENILISAGAGSGKTMVLVERIGKKLINGVKVEELLVLTFTKSAAQEMKERISNYLEATPGMEEEAKKIKNSDITTFDGYFLNFVKKYGYTIGLDSEIAIGEEMVIQKLLLESIEEVLEENYMKIKEENLFTLYLEKYSNYSDSKLIKNLQGLYQEYKKILEKDKLENLWKEKQIENFFTNYEEVILGKYQKVGNLIKKLEKIEVPNKIKNDIAQYIEKIKFRSQESIKDYNGLILHLKNQEIPFALKKNFENKEEVRRIQKQIKDTLETIIKLLIKDPNNDILKSKEEILQMEFGLQQYKDQTMELLQKIDQKFFAKKKLLNVFEYDDITKMAILILEDPKIADEIKKKYEEILVDEYQDTNDFQNHLINQITKKNLYLVGDVKQSIYRFRNANPLNFNELQKRYQKNNQDQVISLLDNFRSREEVLSGINDVFEKIMKVSTSGIDYLDNHALNYGNLSFENKIKEQKYGLQFFNYQPLAKQIEQEEFIFENKNLSSKYDEPILIARDIKKKIANKYEVLDNGELRYCQYKDFVVLTKRKTNYDIYEEVFHWFGINVMIQKEKLFNEAKNFEVMVLISLLKLIDNPKDQHSLMSVGRSFLYQINDQDLHDYIMTKKETKKITEILKKINYLENFKFDSLNRLYNLILLEFNFMNKVINLANKELLYQNMSKIQTITREFDKTGKTLKELIKQLEFALDYEKLKVEVETEVKDKNAVQIMTIHKSKGLEFPVVYLADLEAKIVKPQNEKIQISKDFGIIISEINNSLETSSFLKYQEQFLNKEKEIAETIRLLYVAMTRAKEKIIVMINDVPYQKNKLEGNDSNFPNKTADIIYEVLLPLKKYCYKVSPVDKELLEAFILRNEKTKINSTCIISKKTDLNSKYQYKELIKEFHIIDNLKISREQTEIISSEQRKSIDLGVEIHKFLEMIDFTLLNNLDYQETIKKFLKSLTSEGEKISNLVISDFIQRGEFKNIKNFWTEYQFHEKNITEEINGIIDLILETNTEILIIDYKLSDIDKSAYVRQLKVYKNYLEQVVSKPVKTYLYSLKKQELKEIE